MNLPAAILLTALVLPLPAWAEAVRVMAFGDSLTQGYGLPADQGLVPRLQEWLQDRGVPAQIINAGVAGDTTEEGVKRITADLGRHQPDAVIVELGGNDLLQNRLPGKAERNLDFILRKAGEGRPLLLVGIAKPEPDALLRNSWAAIWPRLAERHDAVLLENLYAPILSLPPQAMAQMLQPDGLHPSAGGVDLLVQELGPKVLELVARTGSSHIDAGLKTMGHK